MEFGHEVLEPVSPSSRYFNNSVLSLSILAVLESENPINESQTMLSIKNLFLPITPRFSSIMVENNGKKQWKRVEVNLEEHVKIPIFPPNLSPESYDKYLDDYISSKLAVERFPQDKPLWEIHIFKYPTSSAAGNLLFKLHHSLGDGFSLMGALISALHRADDPSLPLTFPSRRRTQLESDTYFTKVISPVFNALPDFFEGVLKTLFLNDDISPIRSGNGVEFQPITFTTMTLSLDQVKSIKTKLGVTVNDVLTGMISLGTRLYMQEIDEGYASIQEMIKPDSKLPWGNRVTYLHIPIPSLLSDRYESSNVVLDFVREAQKTIRRKRNPFALILKSKMLQVLERFGGHEAVARYVYRGAKSSSIAMSNLIGPVEQMAWANHCVKGFYFLNLGFPHGLGISIVSYVGEVRIAFRMEKGLIDPHTFKSSMEKAFQMILKASEENLN